MKTKQFNSTWFIYIVPVHNNSHLKTLCDVKTLQYSKENPTITPWAVGRKKQCSAIPNGDFMNEKYLPTYLMEFMQVRKDAQEKHKENNMGSSDRKVQSGSTSAVQSKNNSVFSISGTIEIKEDQNHRLSDVLLTTAQMFLISHFQTLKLLLN